MFHKLMPRLQVKTIYEIDIQQLWNTGVRGIITDLDNTLVGAKNPSATPELLEWLKKLDNIGFKIIIVSNNSRLRVEAFAAPLSLPFIYRAKKPTRSSFRRALKLMNLKPEQTAVIGDQMLTDVLGGNRMGLFTILVQPISLQDEGFFTRINRIIEKVALRSIRRNTG